MTNKEFNQTEDKSHEQQFGFPQWGYPTVPVGYTQPWTPQSWSPNTWPVHPVNFPAQTDAWSRQFGFGFPGFGFPGFGFPGFGFPGFGFPGFGFGFPFWRPFWGFPFI